MASSETWKFKERWRIDGTLQTLTPLHIGSGTPETRAERHPQQAMEDAKKDAEISGIALDFEGRAYIPGSTLKGSLRSWLRDNAAEDPEGCEVFGRTTHAGLAEFWDAPASKDSIPGQSSEREWDASRATCVGARVAIHRKTRTASDEKLFQLEYVPEGVRFKVTICGTGLSEVQVQRLLWLLDRFNLTSGTPLAIGAETPSGFGRMKWQPTRICRLTNSANSVGQWLASGGIAYEELPKLSEKEQADLIAAGLRDSRKSPGSKAVFQVRLRFQGPFLVNDPSQCGSGEEKPKHAPIRDRRKRAYLPGTAFRGAFRSQAERIARTIHGTSGAGYPDQKEYLKSFTVYRKEELSGKLGGCKVSPLFGSPGWRAPLSISDFRAGEASFAESQQEFLAIDRFTGGGADARKFNATHASSPVLEGTLTLDLRRLVMADPMGESLSLFAYTLRDLKEGDILFGFGAAKGYGATVADVRLAEAPDFGSLGKAGETVVANFSKWILDNPHIGK